MVDIDTKRHNCMGDTDIKPIKNRTLENIVREMWR